MKVCESGWVNAGVVGAEPVSHRNSDRKRRIAFLECGSREAFGVRTYSAAFPSIVESIPENSFASLLQLFDNLTQGSGMLMG